MSAPLVSVVIPTYYRNDRLHEAIESVTAQTYDEFEIIVVDGSESARHAEPVAVEHGVEYVCPETDRGAHASRSVGAQSADGQYVNFLDDDDQFAPTKLEKQVSVAENTAEIGVVYCGIQWENGHDVLPNPEVSGNVLEDALMFNMTPSSPSTMLIDTEVLADILPFKNLHGADDMGMKIELAKRTEFDYVDESLVTKGHSEDSLGGSEENIAGRMQLFERYSDLYDRHPASVRRTALGHTYLLDANRTLHREWWSGEAVWKSILAAYYIPGVRLPFIGHLFASFFGRLGLRLGSEVYFKVFIRDSHEGKIT